MSSSLAERLKTETRALHTAAERSKFMRMLLRGDMSLDMYCAFLRNLHAIYETLEPALARHAKQPILEPFALSALQRTAALESDLLQLHGRDWRSAFQLRRSTEAFLIRLQELEQGRPDLLLAHAYVRYLGDLSGGQILRRIVSRSLGTTERAGTAFYDFGSEKETQSLTRAFRGAIGGLVLVEGDVDALVEEAKRSFRLHRRIFHELACEAGWTSRAARLRVRENSSE